MQPHVIQTRPIPGCEVLVDNRSTGRCGSRTASPFARKTSPLRLLQRSRFFCAFNPAATLVKSDRRYNNDTEELMSNQDAAIDAATRGETVASAAG